MFYRANCGSKRIPGEKLGRIYCRRRRKKSKRLTGKNLFACTGKDGGVLSKTGLLRGDGCRGKLPAYMDVQDVQIIFDNTGLFLYDKNGKSGIRAA